METKFWRVDGKLHRIDGPAIEYANGSKEWYINGKRHRIAVEWVDESKEWWVNGVKITSRNDFFYLNPDWTKWTESEKVLFRLAV